MSTVMGLVTAFVQASRDMQKDYVKAWLEGKVNDYDMDMTLIDERQARSSTGTYQRLANEIQNRRTVK